MKKQINPVREAMLFLYDEVDPLMMEKLSVEARMLLQPEINLKKINLKEQNAKLRPLYSEVE